MKWMRMTAATILVTASLAAAPVVTGIASGANHRTQANLDGCVFAYDYPNDAVTATNGCLSRTIKVRPDVWGPDSLYSPCIPIDGPLTNGRFTAQEHVFRHAKQNGFTARDVYVCKK